MTRGLLLETCLALLIFVAEGVPPLTTTAIATAGFHSCALLEDQTAKCWGNNKHGHLGYEDLNNRGDETGEMGNSLLALDFGTGRYAVMLSGGEHHNCVVLDNGDLKCWGRGGQGQLGQGDTKSRGSLPGEMGDGLPTVDLGTGVRAVDVGSGDFHSCAILNNSKLKCWGQGEEGQLGTENSLQYGDQPEHMGDHLPFVDLGADQLVMGIACGDFHNCALLTTGAVKCWGDSLQGQLGYGSTHRRGDHPDEMGDNLPTVDLGTGRTATKVRAGLYHSCALLDDGSVKCWGYGGHGQLGQGTEQDIGKQPGQMGDNLPAIDLGTGRTAVDISCGGTFTCALLDNGSIKCWGENDVGQLGQEDTAGRGNQPGTMGDSLPPVALGDARTATAIASGDRHSCAMLDTGRVKCWGENLLGQLGLENTLTYGANDTTMGDWLPVVDLGTPPTSTSSTSTTTSSATATQTSTASTTTTATLTLVSTSTGTSSATTTTLTSAAASTSTKTLTSTWTSSTVTALVTATMTSSTTSATTATTMTESTMTTTPRPVVEVIAESTIDDLGFTWSGTPPEPLRVLTVQMGSWAAAAGIAAGDEIVALNRNQVATMTPGEVTQALQSSRPLSVTFAPASVGDVGQGQSQSDRYTVTLGPADAQTGFTPLKIEGQPQVVVVTQVQPGTWAETAGLTSWDRLLAANGVSTLGMSATEVAQLLQSTRPLVLIFTPGQAPPSTSSPSTTLQAATTTPPFPTNVPWWLRTTTSTTLNEPWFQQEFLVDSAQLGGRMAMVLWVLVSAVAFW